MGCNKTWFETLMPGIWRELSPGLWVGRVTVSPESARCILSERNACNRPIQPYQVRLLRSELKRGEWLLTGETLIFNTDGKVSNGQHRLTMSVEEGANFETLVVIGVKPEVATKLDQHRRRTAAQVFSSLEESDPALLASSITALHTFHCIGRLAGKIGTGVSRTSPLTITDSLEFLNRHPGLRDSVALVSGLRKSSMLGANGYVTAGHYVFSNVDSELANEMYRRMADMKFPDEPRWSAAQLLIKRLADNARSRAKLSSLDVSALLIKTWNSIRDQTPMSLMRWSAGKYEQYPKVSGWEYEEDVPVGVEKKQ